MNIGLLNILKTVSWDFRRDMAQSYANALKNAIELHIPNDKETHESFFLSKKGSTTARGNFEDKLYVDNIHRIESHLYWNDEELADDDQIVNVVVVDGPVTRDGGGCSYGTKDFRDQVMYANTIPQVVGHIFWINTPGGETACRNDYEMIINDCRKNGKPTVAFVDGMCCSSGVNLASRCDRTIVMNPKDDFGCIGSMAAFWATPDGAVDRDGTRYVEIVGDDSPDKNDWYREAAQGNYEKLQALVNKDTDEFLQTVRENRPLVKDEMLTGKVFEAQEVMPALVDEIGDMNRAIECVFELADGRLQSAHEATVVNEPEPEEPESNEPEDKAQEAVAKQQPTEKGNINPINDNNMTDEEKKAAEVAEQPAATKEETQAPSNSPEGGEQGKEAPTVSEESPAQEEQPSAGEEAPAQAPSNSPEGGEQPAATEQPSEQAVEDAAAEIEKITETLHTAEAMVTDRDKEIACLKETLATLNGIAEERDAAIQERDTANTQLNEKVSALTAAETKIAEHVATIEKLKKQVSDLKGEVKELSGQPTPMVDAESGIPADNGTGDAPKQKKRITSGMSYEEIRALQKGDK